MGAVCIKRQSRCDGNLNYPIINKLMKFQPDKQFPLVKPHSHSDMVEETYEMNYLEIILNFQEIPLKKKQETKAIPFTQIQDQQKQKTQEQQIKTEQELKEQILDKEQTEKCLKMNRSVTQNSIHHEQQDDCSVILNKNQAGSDTQTIRSILKTNKSKSHKSVQKVTQSSSQKKVSFEPRLLKQKNRNFFM
ncbi:unnamed protein product [Paramecium pentaurelia]|uniref:Uncharacterized protein n=1 Tax=Paramecium pentaurelia TaxID=43138 RepID=A0A8S1WG64_9CILI|nr:unnamed protein product [Paramecium pentaurelia]